MTNASIPSDIAPFAQSWAEVRARGHVVRYRRSGTGRTVIVFGVPERDGPGWPDLLDALGAGFRLLIPEPPPTDDDIPCWLSSFLEGLGMPGVRLVAAGRLCAPALQLALVEGDQLAGVVLIAERGGRAAAGGASVADGIRELKVPVLVVDPSLPADEVIPLVTGFLRGG